MYREPFLLCGSASRLRPDRTDLAKKIQCRAPRLAHRSRTAKFDSGVRSQYSLLVARPLEVHTARSPPFFHNGKDRESNISPMPHTFRLRRSRSAARDSATFGLRRQLPRNPIFGVVVRPALVLETPGAAFHTVLHKVSPYKLDHARVVVAVSEIVIQRREAMPLAGLLHAGELS